MPHHLQLLAIGSHLDQLYLRFLFQSSRLLSDTPPCHTPSSFSHDMRSQTEPSLFPLTSRNRRHPIASPVSPSVTQNWHFAVYCHRPPYPLPDLSPPPLLEPYKSHRYLGLSLSHSNPHPPRPLFVGSAMPPKLWRPPPSAKIRHPATNFWRQWEPPQPPLTCHATVVKPWDWRWSLALLWWAELRAMAPCPWLTSRPPTCYGPQDPWTRLMSFSVTKKFLKTLGNGCFAE
jgi:hypothetical protein